MFLTKYIFFSWAFQNKYWTKIKSAGFNSDNFYKPSKAISILQTKIVRNKISFEKKIFENKQKAKGYLV